MNIEHSFAKCLEDSYHQDCKEKLLLVRSISSVRAADRKYLDNLHVDLLLDPHPHPRMVGVVSWNCNHGHDED